MRQLGVAILALVATFGGRIQFAMLVPGRVFLASDPVVGMGQ